MALVIVENTQKEGEVNEGEKIRDTVEELGIYFGCKQGMCGTCKIEVIEGMENLNEKNEPENEMELESYERLACQCKINQGIVKIRQI